MSTPDMMGSFIGVVEIVCSSLRLFGLATRLAALSLAINMQIDSLSTAESPVEPIAST